MSISTNTMYQQPQLRNALGQSLPAASITTAAPSIEKKLLVVLQYWEGDRARVEQQAHLIADLERVPNKNADIMLYARHDAGAFDISAIQRLQSKFGTVHQVRCRRRASGYPYGANEMFYDLLDIMSNNAGYSNRYYAFLNLESDCCPTRPGWTEELIKAYRTAEIDGKLMIGHRNKTPAPHMNGVGVYAVDIQRRLGTMQMIGGPAQHAYDIYLAPRIMPVADDTPLIALDFQRPTISAEDLFAPRKEGVVPALFHGVKDESAFAIVRSKFVTLDGQIDLTHKTVFTYFDAVPEIDANEQKAQIELWKEAWKSRGWNPIVLTWIDARKHSLYEEFENAVKVFPTVNPKKYELSCFLRWLALEQAGGGLMSDYDCVPGRLMPRDLEDVRSESGVMHVLQSNETTAVPACVYADRTALRKWIKYVMTYKPSSEDKENGSAHISDQSIVTVASAEKKTFVKKHKMVLEFGEPDYKTGYAIHFANSACSKFKPGNAKSRCMLEYLRSA